MSSTAAIPSLLLKQLYTFGSLENTDDGFTFALKNRLTDTRVKALTFVRVDEADIPHTRFSVETGGGEIVVPASDGAHPAFDLPLGQVLVVRALGPALAAGKHHIEIAFEAETFGELLIDVEDAISGAKEHLTRVPRSDDDDYSADAIQGRQRFVEAFTGTQPEHLWQYSFDAHAAQGNCELFTGVAQVPLGFAGPIHVNGEHAQGEFLIPLATTEGTLIASYNRGIKVLNLCGGVRCTVVGDAMQRAPVFVFEDARAGREFVKWVAANDATIRDHAEATSSVARLQYIDPYLSNKFVYLRFNYSTGDAAGQNMVGRATFAACSWILDHYEGISHFYLESNFATDKKASQINIMRTRGKRVTAEAVVKRDVLVQQMRVEPESLHYHAQVSNVGAFISGANNNGAHSPNAITAMFIATGQDVANVAEASAGILYSELTPGGDLYISITIPSLIVATYGGGTGLPTQRECLDIMGCFGKGKVNKLAEIVAGVVLAGELSLGAAISSLDWVSSHEKYGRNR
jgi:hydroxymethylglutaryl-CoA reductase (NADPH)